MKAIPKSKLKKIEVGGKDYLILGYLEPPNRKYSPVAVVSPTTYDLVLMVECQKESGDDVYLAFDDPLVFADLRPDQLESVRQDFIIYLCDCLSITEE